MTQVDFYILNNADEQHHLTFICHLTKKIYRLGLNICILAQHQADIDKLSNLLWNNDSGSFLPHNIHNKDETLSAPITLGETLSPVVHPVLINLRHDIPTACSQFTRIVEVVPHNNPLREISREHWHAYKVQGYTVKAHNINNLCKRFTEKFSI